MENQSIVKASKITSTKVKNMAREKLGEINDVVIDKMFGKVSYLVLDFGGVLGFGNKFFAIPWHLFTYDTNDDCFLLNVDKQQLNEAPGFDKEHWPNFAEPDYALTINKYYQNANQKRSMNRFTSEIFTDKESAELAYKIALQQGYKPEDITVLMSDDTRKQYYDSPLTQDNVRNASVKGLGIGSLIGGTIGGTFGAIASIGTSLIIPALGIIIAGPIAAGLAGAGVGSISGGLLGALVGWGVPEEKAKFYEVGIRSGGIVLAVDETSSWSNLEKDWKKLLCSEKVY